MNLFDRQAPHNGKTPDVDYVKKTRRDTALVHGDSYQMKDLIASIKQEKKLESELIKRHNPAEDDQNGPSSPSSAQNAYMRAKPKVATRNPLYQKHFFENLSLAEKIKRHHQEKLPTSR